MGRTAYTEPQCLYRVHVTFSYLYKKVDNQCECVGNRDFTLLITSVICASHNLV